MIKITEQYDWTKALSLMEADHERQDFMSDREKALKKRLYKLLKDDGKGHHHAMYAKRLKKYDINIVPIGKQPETAAISFDEGIIYINEGFLSDPKTFDQLNVIMRHELCHNLLLHQIRMMKYISDIPWSHLKMSNSIHELLNIIEDFEISNKKYSTEDKEVIRNMWLNGQLISGLVTEDHRANWMFMSLEEMYDAIMAEIQNKNNSGYLSNSSSGNLSMAAAKLHSFKQDLDVHADFDSLPEFKDYLTAQFKRNKDFKHDKDLQQLLANFIQVIDDLSVIETDPNVEYTTQDIADMLKQISNMKAIKEENILSPKGGEILATVYTPEEKSVAATALKILGGNTAYPHDYARWYQTVMATVGLDPELTEDDIKALFDCMK